MTNLTIIIPLTVIAVIILYRHKFVEEWEAFRTDRKSWSYDKWKNWGEPFVIALVLALVIRTFILGPYKIPTGSMIPTFMVGDRIFVDKVSYRFREPERGEIIVFKYPLEKKKDFVKRLVGLPGERLQIRDGQLLVNGEKVDAAPISTFYYYNRDDWEYGKRGAEYVVPDDKFFVLGDNSGASSDSRNWGFVPRTNIVGRAFFIWWPFNRVKLAK